MWNSLHQLPNATLYTKINNGSASLLRMQSLFLRVNIWLLIPSMILGLSQTF
jgi:hypothetical protein